MSIAADTKHLDARIGMTSVLHTWGSAMKRLQALEDDNGKLKKLLAEQMLDNAMLRDITAKKW